MDSGYESPYSPALKNVDAEDVDLCVEGGGSDFTQERPEGDQDYIAGNSSLDLVAVGTLSSSSVDDKNALEGDSEDVELGNFFFEDASPSDALPPDILDLQKKGRLRELNSEKNFEKLEDIWKKVITCFVLLYNNLKYI